MKNEENTSFGSQNSFDKKVMNGRSFYGSSSSDDTPRFREVLYSAVLAGDVTRAREMLTHRGFVDLDREMAVAAEGGNNDLIRLLVANGARVNCRDITARTPLHYSAIYSKSDTAKLLLEFGAVIDARTNLKQTPLHIAARNGLYDMSQLLLSAGAEVDVRDVFSDTPLGIAAAHDHLGIVTLLLKHKADPNNIDLARCTPLHMSMYCKTPNIARVLIEAGALVNSRHIKGRTPMYLACKAGKRDFIRVLADAGADLYENIHIPVVREVVLDWDVISSSFHVHPRVRPAAVAMMLCSWVVDREHPFHAFPPELITQLLHEMSCMILLEH